MDFQHVLKMDVLVDRLLSLSEMDRVLNIVLRSLEAMMKPENNSFCHRNPKSNEAYYRFKVTLCGFRIFGGG